MKILKNNRGIAIIYVTLFLMVLGILFFALGIDIGWMVYVKSQGQSATDASALAGSAAIPNANSSGNQTKVNELASLFNTDNTVMNQAAGIAASDVQLCDGDPNSPTCPATDITKAGGVKVTKTYNTPLFFTRFLNGASSTNITVSSTAWLGGPSGTSPELPVVLCEQAIYSNPNDPNRECVSPYSVKFSPNGRDNGGYWNGDPAPGNPSPPHANASQCKDWVANQDHIPYINIGQEVGLNNGQINSCHKDIEDKYKDCSPASCNGSQGQAKKDLCTVILPVIQCPNNINQHEPVKEFAALCITSVVSNPASKSHITGELACNVPVPGSLGGGPQQGVYAAKPVLVQ